MTIDQKTRCGYCNGPANLETDLLPIENWQIFMCSNCCKEILPKVIIDLMHCEEDSSRIIENLG